MGSDIQFDKSTASGAGRVTLRRVRAGRVVVANLPAAQWSQALAIALNRREAAFARLARAASQVNGWSARTAARWQSATRGLRRGHLQGGAVAQTD
jgi:hypothetical protein